MMDEKNNTIYIIDNTDSELVLVSLKDRLSVELLVIKNTDNILLIITNRFYNNKINNLLDGLKCVKSYKQFNKYTRS